MVILLTVKEILPTFDFKIPLTIKNLEKKQEILELWDTAKNASSQNDSKTISQKLRELTKLDDSQYGVWYNLGIAENFNRLCFEKAIELKLDHIDSWKGKCHYHYQAAKLPYGDDTLDLHLHLNNADGCEGIIHEINEIQNTSFLVFEPTDEKFTSYWVDMMQEMDMDQYLTIGLTLMKYSKYNEAKTIFDIYLEYESGTTRTPDYRNFNECLESMDALCHFFKGIIFRKIGNFKKSLEMFDELLGTYPKNTRILTQKQLTVLKMKTTFDSNAIKNSNGDSDKEIFKFYTKIFETSPPFDYADTKGLFNFNNLEVVHSTLKNATIPEICRK
jgi:hypothetical protein